MLSKLSTFILLAAFVRAQTPTTSDGLPWATISPCGLHCLENAQGCASYTDISCICTNSLFQNAVTACIQANCLRSDLAAVLALHVTECAGGEPWSSSSLITSSRSIPSSSEPSNTSSSNTSIPSSTPVRTGSSTTTPSRTPSSSSSSGPSPSPGTGGNSGAAVGRNGELFGSMGAVIAVLSVAVLSFQ